MRRVFAFLGVLLASCGLFAFDFVIDDFHLDVRVDLANSYEITQSLEVDYQRPCHGFIQDIPLRFGRKKVAISDIASSEPLSAEVSDTYAELRFGEADRHVSGRKNYLLSYRYSVGGDEHEEYDEVYLNLIGTSWESPIRQGSFSLTLPKDPGGRPQAWLTYGYEGSTSQAPLSYDGESRTFTGSVTNLLPGQGMTVRIELPEGYFSEVPDELEVGKWLVVASFLLSLALFILACMLWSRYGRDELVAPVPDWHAPDGLSPLEVGYLYDGKVDGRDLTGMFFYWADQGCLTMKELHKGVWQLTKIKEPEGTRAFERKFFDALFREGDGAVVTTRDIQSESFARACQKVRLETCRYFRHERALKDPVADSKKLSIQLFLLIPLVLGAVGACWGFLDGSFVAMVVVGLVCELLTANVIHGGLEKGMVGKVFHIVLALFLAGAASLVNFSIAVGYQYLPLWQGLFATASTVLFPSAMSGIAQATERRSEYGAKMHARILGFRDFIEKVEMDRLRMLVSQSPQLFFHILGYAMALGLEDAWARNFEKLGERMLSPSWMETSSPLDSYLLFSAMSRGMVGPVRGGMTFQEAPRGGNRGNVGSFSGFSGHSGGGFGGGGGRSW